MQFNSFAAFFSSSFSYLPICIIKKRNICLFSLPSCRWESENGSSTVLTNQCLQFSGCHLFFPWELMLQSTGLQVTSTYHLCWHGLSVFSPWFHIIMASQVVKGETRCWNWQFSQLKYGDAAITGILTLVDWISRMKSCTLIPRGKLHRIL